MDGPLLKKGWFDRWKPRYIKCDDRFIKIYHMKDLQNAKSVMTLNGCSVKEIPQQQFNKSCVFSIKADDKKLILAANSESEYSKWISYLKRYAKRPSVLTTNITRNSSISAANRKSILATVHCDRPSLVLDSNHVANAYENEYAFSELCLQFIQLLQDHFDNSPDTPIPGVELQAISDTERSAINANMKSSIEIMHNKVDNIFIPLQCIVDDKTGKSYSAKLEFYLPKHRPLSKLSKSKIQLLELFLGISPSEMEKINFFEDNRGRLWVMDSSELTNILKSEISDNQISEFAKQLDNGSAYVYDSASLIMFMKTHRIPVSKLPMLYSQSKTSEAQENCMIEMIVRSCKPIYREYLSKEGPVGFLNVVFGSSKQSKNMLNNKIVDSIKKKFRIKINISQVSKPKLLNAFQFHYNIQLNMAKTYNFNSDKPFTSKDIKSYNSVIHHNFIELSNEIFHKHQDPADLMTRQFYKKAIKVLNQRIALLQSLYNESSEYITNDILLLMMAHLEHEDSAMAEVCYTSISTKSNGIALPLSSLFLISKSDCDIQPIVENTLNEIRKINGHNSLLEIEFLKKVAKYNPKYLDSAIESARQHFGNDHPSVIYTMIPAMSYEDMKKNLPVITNYFGKDSGQLSYFHYMLAEKLIETNQFRDALYHAIESYKLRRITKKEAIVFESIQQIAFIYDELNEGKNALKYYSALYLYLRQNDDFMTSQLIILQNILRMCCRLARIDFDTTPMNSQLEVMKTNDVQLKSFVSQIESTDPLTIAGQLLDGNVDKLAYLIKVIQLNPEQFHEAYGCQ